MYLSLISSYRVLGFAYKIHFHFTIIFAYFKGVYFSVVLSMYTALIKLSYKSFIVNNKY